MEVVVTPLSLASNLKVARHTSMFEIGRKLQAISSDVLPLAVVSVEGAVVLGSGVAGAVVGSLWWQGLASSSRQPVWLL